MKKKIALGLIAALTMATVIGCGSPGKESAGYTDGTYEGVGAGYKGDIKVSVEVKGGKITDVKVLEQAETEGLGDKAAEEVAQKIVKENSVEVEGVSGATGSSNGVKEAVKKALEAK
ncbi:FMN-binding protein [Alkaliphilus oremlandii]|uniref:FMN-binding domain protein n=1 Tax=Alkaliphilus oremlandii (strain OhILAs) TaxID=350688 RepID=A8MIK5_ALKOO|nr:FMN-binding protein [Alkaliphilus oremlandii]ABW19637.1 FMN-binding domain protein [Alkaliphilus oremlandii OhILAs]